MNRTFAIKDTRIKVRTNADKTVWCLPLAFAYDKSDGFTIAFLCFSVTIDIY